MNGTFGIRSWFGWAMGVVFCCSTTRAQVVSIFAPAIALGTNDGNGVLAPFDGEAGRFQQVSESSEFGSLSATGGGWILAVAFRGDAWFGRTFDEVIPSVQLNLSTTARAPDALSAVFDENVGSDDTVVLGPRAVHISDIAGGGNSGFGTFLDFRDRPFFYDPLQGNLLIDFRIDQGLGTRPGGVVVLDAFDVAGDSVSTVFGYGSSVPSSGSTASIGLAAEFFVVPIPEPQPLSMLIIGAVAVTFLHFWPRRRVRRLIYEQNIADLYAFDSNTALAPVGNVTIAYTPLFMFPQAVFRENIFRYLDDAPAVAGANGQRSYAFGLYSFSDTLIEDNVVGLNDPHLIYHGLSHNVRAFNNAASAGETLPIFHDLSGGGTLFEQEESLEDRVRDTLFFALL